MALGFTNFLVSFFGGFSWQSYGKRANVAKLVILLVLFTSSSVFAIKSWKYKLIPSLLVAFFIAGVKTYAYVMNNLYDKATVEEDEENERENRQEDLGFQLPPGISLQLWERRKVIFDHLYDLDEAAFLLISEGYDADAIYALIGLVSNGTINRQTKISKKQPKSNNKFIFRLCGKNITVKMGRDELNAIIDRPSSILEIIICFFVAAITIFAIGTFQRTFYCIGMAFILAFSLFSLILQPLSEPYGMMLGDNTYKYTRCLHIIIFAAINYAMLHYGIDWSLMAILTICLPLFVVFGIVGHAILTIHYLIETFNLYVFGIVGSPTVWQAFLDLLLNSLYIGIGYLIMPKLPSKFTPLILVALMSLVSNFTVSSRFPYRVKQIICIITYTVFATLSSLIPIYANSKHYNLIIMILLIIFDLVIPYTQCYNQYLITYNKFYTLPPIIFKIIDNIRSFLLGIIISNALKGTSRKLEAVILPLLLFRLAMSTPQLGAISVIVYCMTCLYEFKYDSSCRNFVISIAVAIKLLSVYRVMSASAKNQAFSEATNHIYFSFILNVQLILLPTPFRCLNTMSLLYSFITGEAQSSLYGFGFLMFFSYPRPYTFVESESIGSKEVFITNEISQRVEIPAYISLSQELERVLNERFRCGQLGYVLPDSFFLFTTDNLVGIIHVISVSMHDVHFDCRFTEYASVTLCHETEITQLAKLVEESRDYGNATQSIIYRLTAFSLKTKTLRVEGFSLSNNSLETVFQTLNMDRMHKWAFYAVVYTVMTYNTKQSRKNSLESQAEPSEDVESAHEGINLQNYDHEEGKKSPSKRRRQTADSNNHEEESVDFTDAEIEQICFFLEKYNVSYDGAFLTINNLLAGFMETIKLSNEGEFQTRFNEANTIEGEICRTFTLLILMDSVGIAPEDIESHDSLEDVLAFIEESLETRAIPLSSTEEIIDIAKGNSPAILLRTIANGSQIIRYGKAEKDWAVFHMETGIIRGLWSGEITEIIFGASALNERFSNLMDLNRLRNITNQSINAPVGYPVYVTPILVSV